MRKMLLLTPLSLVGMLVFAPVALAADSNCSDFKYQEDAQAAYSPDLDSDGNGIACESLPSRGGGGGGASDSSSSSSANSSSSASSSSPSKASKKASKSTASASSSTSAASNTATSSGSSATTGNASAAAGGKLPSTGGVGIIAVVAGALLLGSGVMSLRLIRRR
jgi:hypothetical protein